MTHRLLALMAASLLLGGSGSAQAAQLERSDVQPDQPTKLTLAKGATLEIKGVYGDLTVVRAPGPDTIVSVTRDAGADAPRIEMVTHDRGVTLCAIYASPNPKKPNACVPGTKGRLTEGTHKGSPATRFRVALADGVHIMGRLAIGDIKVKSGTGDVDVATLLGNISIVDGGSRVVQAAVSLQGNLDAVLSGVTQRPDQRTVRLEVMNGDLRVTPPSTLRIYYYIATERAIENTFTDQRLHGGRGARTGYWGPPGPTEMSLSLSTGTLFGRLRLLRPAA